MDRNSFFRLFVQSQFSKVESQFANKKDHKSSSFLLQKIALQFSYGLGNFREFDINETLFSLKFWISVIHKRDERER